MDYAGNYSPDSLHWVSEWQMGRHTNSDRATNTVMIGPGFGFTKHDMKELLSHLKHQISINCLRHMSH